YAVERVTAAAPDGRQVEYVPFYSIKHAAPEGGAAEAFWYATRKPAEQSTPDDASTELHLSLVDLNFQPTAPADWTLDVETTCLNRDLPGRLPFGGGQPRLLLSESGAPLAPLVCLTPPTRTLRPALRQGARWRLLSPLTLTH